MLEPLVLVDAACDVPPALLQMESVRLLPTYIQSPQGRVADRHQKHDLLELLQQLERMGPSFAQPQEAQPSELITMINQWMADHKMPIVGLSRHKQLQAMGACSSPLLVGGATLLDCATGFAGYAVQMVDLLEQRQRGARLSNLLRRVQRNSESTHVFVVPSRLDFLKRNLACAEVQGINRLSTLASNLMSVTPILYAHHSTPRVVGRRVGVNSAREVLFAKVRRIIHQDRLISPHIVLSYSGNLDEVELMPGFQRLVTVARRWGVTVHPTIMSMTNALYLGPRALSVGFLARNKDRESLHSQDE